MRRPLGLERHVVHQGLRDLRLEHRAAPRPARAAAPRWPAPCEDSVDRLHRGSKARDRVARPAARRTSPASSRERPIRCCSWAVRFWRTASARCSSGIPNLADRVASLLQRHQRAQRRRWPRRRAAPRRPSAAAGPPFGGAPRRRGPRGRGPRCSLEELALELVRLVLVARRATPGLGQARAAVQERPRRGRASPTRRPPRSGRCSTRSPARSSSIHPRSRGQPRISASWATSTSLCPPRRRWRW